MILRLQEGLLALWRGWVPSVIGVIPYVGLNFAVYETLKDAVIQVSGLLTYLLAAILSRCTATCTCVTEGCRSR